ncbi:MAG: hypothetical protein FWG29_03100 [Treponema sp.]|nr:hypothetical protein [Treponema sp.]
MSFEKSFLYWSERGLVTTFFLDLMQYLNPAILVKFISLIDFETSLHINPEAIKRFDIIIEPGFSNTGFGHPDAVFYITFHDNKKYIFILEAKQGKYLNSSTDNSSRNIEKYNSSLNGQLELNYCLSLALSNFKLGDTILVEPEWILKTPYNDDRKGKLRCLKDAKVIKNVIPCLSSEPLENYFHVILTSDNENPLKLNNTKGKLPQLFTKEIINDELKTIDIWKRMKKRHYGWVNYIKLLSFVKHYEKDYFLGSFFNKTFELNNPGKNVNTNKRPSSLLNNKPINTSSIFKNDRGICLIYVPSIAKNTFLHFSWGNSKGDKDACAIRNFLSETQNPLRKYTTTEIEKIVKQIFFVDIKLSVDKVMEWKKIIIEYNKKYLQN